MLKMTEKEAEAFFTRIGKPMPINAHTAGVAAVKKELDTLIPVMRKILSSNDDFRYRLDPKNGW